MNNRRDGISLRLEPAGLFILGAASLQLSHRQLSSVLGTEQMNPLAVQQLLLLYGISFLALALISFFLSRNGRTIAGLVADQFAAGSRSSFSIKPATRLWRPLGMSTSLIALMLTVGFAVRLYFLDQPMRYDESVSFLAFVRGDTYRLFVYSMPNNHVFNTILEKLSCWLVGPSPLGIRLPAFCAGVALMVASCALSRKLVGEEGGVLTATVLALSPYLVLYSTNGRGYALLALLVVLIIHLSVDKDGKSLTGRWTLPALLTALAIFVMPSMLYALSGLCLWFIAVLALQKRNLRSTLTGFALPYVATTTFASLLLYSPVLLFSGGVGPIISNRFVRPLPAEQFMARIVPHVVETAQDMSTDIPWPVVMLVIALAVYGTVVALRQGNRVLGLLLPCLLIGSAGLFLVKRSIPFTRTWIYLLPIVAVVADAGFTELLERLPTPPRRLILLATSALGVAFAVHMVAHRVILAYPGPGAFESGEAVAQLLAPRLSVGDIVCAELPADGPTAYYLWRALKQRDYLARPVSNRKYWIHLGHPLQDSDWGAQDAAVMFTSDAFTLYDTSEVISPPKTISSPTCWSPAAQAEL